MTSADYEAGARAAGALAFTVDQAHNRIAFSGETGLFGLASPDMDWPDFMARLGPADQANLEQAFEGNHIDLRVRLIGDDGAVAYARLLGRRVADRRFEGLMTPAGRTGEGALRIREEHALANGVEAGEVLAYYQPIIALETGRLAGFEALARWERPGLGVLAPDDFLDMADELDLLDRISNRVRASAAEDLSSWRTAYEHARRLFVAANATVSELISPSFATDLLTQINRAQLPPGSFKLEIAETEIMRDPERAAQAMAVLSDGGVALSLDDFGTGYSSLARLEMLPFNVVKIDRYFVRALAGNDSAGTVVKSVIQLARHFEMSVVAEGVETRETADELRAMGCEYAQGFRYAGALSPVAAVRAIQEGIAGRFLPPD